MAQGRAQGPRPHPRPGLPGMRPGSCRALAQYLSGGRGVFRSAVPSRLQDEASFMLGPGLGRAAGAGVACSLGPAGGCLSWLEGHLLVPSLYSLFVPQKSRKSGEFQSMWKSRLVLGLSLRPWGLGSEGGKDHSAEQRVCVGLWAAHRALPPGPPTQAGSVTGLPVPSSPEGTVPRRQRTRGGPQPAGTAAVGLSRGPWGRGGRHPVSTIQTRGIYVLGV